MSSTEDDGYIIMCTDELNNLHITCTEIGIAIDRCACCGKEGSNLNVCNKCKEAKYCNVACKKKHRSKHKKKCERRAAEILAELHEIELFKRPPPPEDCPICMLLLPSLDSGSKYKACCGKMICSGCIHAVEMRDNGVGLCPFCRTQTPTLDKELVKLIKKRVEVGDATAMLNLGNCYSEGLFGLPQDTFKAMELYHEAGKLGNADAYCNIGTGYYRGRGVERDEKKANHYYELAAIGGCASARHNLGYTEMMAGNWDRAIKHWLIAAGDGLNDSVQNIRQMYLNGNATKEDYTKALLAYQKYLDEIKSEQRDQAAAFDDEFKYY